MPKAVDDAPPLEIRDELLTVSEVAGQLKVPVSWVYDCTRWRGAAQILHFKPGKYLRFSVSGVRRWLKEMQER